MCIIDPRREVGIKLKGQTFGSVFIFGVYLTSHKDRDEYKDELNILDTSYFYYNNYGTVLIAGNMNASCLVGDNAHSNRCFCDMYKASDNAHFDKTNKDHVDAMYSEIINSNSDVDINLPGGQITREEVNDIFKG